MNFIFFFCKLKKPQKCSDFKCAHYGRKSSTLWRVGVTTSRRSSKDPNVRCVAFTSGICEKCDIRSATIASIFGQFQGKFKTTASAPGERFIIHQDSLSTANTCAPNERFDIIHQGFHIIAANSARITDK